MRSYIVAKLRLHTYIFIKIISHKTRSRRNNGHKIETISQFVQVPRSGFQKISYTRIPRRPTIKNVRLPALPRGFREYAVAIFEIYSKGSSHTWMRRFYFCLIYATFTPSPPNYKIFKIMGLPRED